MKIVEAISDSNIGGAGRVLLNRLSAQNEYSTSTTVLLPRGSELIKGLKENSIDYIEINGCHDRSFDFFAIFEFMNILRDISPDVINCHGCLSCRIAAFICGIPVRIYTKHCVFPLKKIEKNRLVRLLTGTSQLILSHHIIAVASAAKENLIEVGCDEKKITVIINGVEPIMKINTEERLRVREILNIPKESIVVGIFARIEEYKGHMDFLNAANILVKKDPSFRFLIVGKGSLYDDIRSSCEKMGLGDHVIFTGFIYDVGRYLNITDINVNCSYGTETSSLSLSEGMSLGIPCVVSEYGGNPHMVENGKNGFTYPIHDSAYLAEKIFLLSHNKTLYQKMSENAFCKYKSELNAKEMSRQTYALYERLVSRLK